MPDNLQKSKLLKVLALIRDRLDAIKILQKEVPHLEEAKEGIEWMLKSEEVAPEAITFFPSEKILGHLDNLEQYMVNSPLFIFDQGGPSIISASGTASSSDYVDHARGFLHRFPEDKEVSKWCAFVAEGYNQLRESQNRSDQVNIRLGKLNKRLKDLHKQAKDAVLIAVAKVQSPIEGGELMRELLVSFKGELIRRCKSGRGTDYSRIAENLAVASQATIDAIVSQQEVYDNLHHELSEIAKRRQDVHQYGLKELMSNLEDHLLIITDSLDPKKSGVEFI
jgi:hypothetical protein